MKARFLVITALILGMVSCQKDQAGLDVIVDGEQETTISVSLPETTRATDSAQGAFKNVNFDEYTIRYILQVYYKGAPSKERLVKYSDEKSVVFPVRLVPGRDYNFVVWADLVRGNDFQDNDWSNADGLHYNTTDLHNITLKDTWVAMDETRDAFTGYYNTEDHGVKYSGNLPIDITLTRPFAKLRVITTDMKELGHLGIVPDNGVVTYTTQFHESFNAFNGQYGAETVSKTHISFTIKEFYDDEANKSKVLFTDYFFADDSDVVKFVMNVNEANGTLIKSNAFTTDIPVKRNYLTTIQGNILSDCNNIEVKVEDNGNFDGEIVEKIVEVGNATDLQKAINEADENTTVVLGGDIDLGTLFGASTSSTRTTAATLPIVIAEDKEVVLDLNGHNLTTPWEVEAEEKHYYAFDNHGSLTIQDSKGDGQIIARGIFNYGTMTLKSGTINACDGNGGYGVRNYKDAEFVMNGGSIVTSKEDGDKPGVGYDACPVRVDEGATATINGGAINNVSNYTFAIDNYGETTIYDGTFTTIHTTIANSASMTINGGSFTCNGLEGVTAHALWAAEGTTTINGGIFNGKDNYNGFNVSASAGAVVNINGGKFLPVHSGSLYGEGTIIVKGGEFFDNPSARVDSDYTVEKKDDMYVVSRKADVAKIGEVGYTSLQKAVDAAENGATVTFISDIEQVEGVLITDKNITIDLNNKMFTVSEGANTNNRNIKVNGTSVVTIKNGTMKANGNYTSGAYGTLRTEGTANVTLVNVKLYNYRGNGLNVKAYSGTTVTINDSEIYSQYGGGVEAAGGTVELTNVKIEQKGMYTAPYNSMAISVNGGGTATVNSGTYSTECLTAEEANNQGTSHGPWCAGVLNSGGTLIIKGGTFSNDNFGENTLATAARGLLLADTGANIQIKGGVFNAVKAIVDIQNNLGNASQNPSATILGGDFSYDPRISASYSSNLIKVATGYKVVENNGRWAVVVDPAAKIGETEYATLQEAFNVGGNITLLRNVTVAETVTLAEGKTATLDLNGKTISGTMHKNVGAVVKNDGTLTVKNGFVKSTADNGGSAIQNSGSLTVNDATLNGAPNADGSWPSYTVNNTGVMTLNNTTITSYHGAVASYNNGAVATLNKCTIDMAGIPGFTSHGIYTYNNGTVIVNGGTYENKATDQVASGASVINGAVEVNAGTFSGRIENYFGTPVLKGGTFSVKPNANFIPKGYKVIEENGKFVVVAE